MLYGFLVIARLAKNLPVKHRELVGAGDTVSWTNLDTVDHTVTEGTPGAPVDGGFDSGNVAVGETFEVTLDWHLRRDVSEQSFVVPLFDQTQNFRVEPAPIEGRQTLTFSAGSSELQLPYERTTVNLASKAANLAKIRSTGSGTGRRQGPEAIKGASSMVHSATLPSWTVTSNRPSPSPPPMPLRLRISYTIR